jgi:hypothetical protein
MSAVGGRGHADQRQSFQDFASGQQAVELVRPILLGGIALQGHVAKYAPKPWTTPAVAGAFASG